MSDTNKRVDVRFFNQQLELIGDIDDYAALTYTRKWTTYNTFEMHVSKFDGELIQRGNFIMLNSDRYRSGIITYFEDNERETNDITIRGFCPRFLLFERPTIPPNGQDYDTYNTEVENILIGLIDRNCVNPENGNRKIPFLSCAKSKNRGEKTSFQTAHKVLKDEISSLCTASNLGTATYFDPTTKQIRLKCCPAPTELMTTAYARLMFLLENGTACLSETIQNRIPTIKTLPMWLGREKAGTVKF